MSTYYITTAIDYVNARPHLGTAYEKIGADCLARYKRLCGVNTWFLMGTDEHSTNVEKEARRLGKDPQAYTDEMAETFDRTWKALHISYDQFIRTTSEAHKQTVRYLFQRIYDNGYIYEGEYEGLYCEGCEEFKADKDLEDGKCPRHHTEAQHIKEKNYFFALSKFSEPLEEHIRENPDFIRPAMRRNEILKVIEGGLEDVSVSRRGKDWGVKLPIDEDHVVYVWFDALINYISALGFGEDPAPRFQKFWPADCHIIGKDITRFHCLIWPAMLLAAGVPLARSVFAHGFVYNRGEKMSKTIGNIVDPADMAAFFGADALRYLMLREIAFDRDGDFTVELFVARYNAELANELGNLFSRTLSMTQRYFQGNVPEWNDEAAAETERLTGGVAGAYRRCMDALAFDEGLDALWRVVQSGNRYVEERKPWAQAKLGDTHALGVTLRALLEVLRVCSVLCWPFMPEKSADMRRQLGLSDDFSEIHVDEAIRAGASDWQHIGESAVLFPRLELPDA